MKVGTDSLMLGSWTNINHAKHILDIGTGSGLLAIMLAQKVDKSCQIVGIDIDADAINQAKQNALNSPWSPQLQFNQACLQEHVVSNKYDLIISNPPYFTENISANKIQVKANRQTARQTLTLDHQTLLHHVASLLAEQGAFYCVLPAQSAELFCTFAQSLGLYCVHRLEVATKPKAKSSRVLMAFSFKQTKQQTQKLTIYTCEEKYSADYVSLCKDYYLHF